MAEHSELLAELPVVEKMTTQERLKHARKRRAHQLKMWNQREKEYGSKRNKSLQKKYNKIDYKVHFDPSVMLLEAAARNDVKEVHRLLLLNVNPDSTNEDGLTALHQCCIDDNEELMKLLLEFGADINAEDSEKWTPLHAAATCGHLNLARYLINKGANLLAVNGDGNMPYDICEDDKTLDLIESEMAKQGVTQQLIDDTRASTEMKMLQDLQWLVEEDGDLDFQDEQGATYLHIAAANGYISVAEFLLDNGANPNICDNDSWHPVHSAACWGHPEILDMLVQHGADVKAETKIGETPYDICEDPELKERIQQLKNEMEIRQSAQQMTRLRRSQSQNTRSHSVRRTSLRDKSQISWKEAREEAKLRLVQPESTVKLPNEKQMIKKHDDPVNINDISLSMLNDKISEGESSLKTKAKTSSSLKSYPQEIVSSKREVPDTKQQQESPNSSYHNDNRKNGSNNRHDSDRKENNNPTACATAFAVSQSQADLKVDLNIHVTVNTGPTYNANGTLADLKRHRADLRNRSGSVVSSHEFVTTTGDKVNGVEVQSIEPYKLHSPPSPVISRQKFYDHSEIVGPPEKHSCCRLM